MKATKDSLSIVTTETSDGLKLSGLMNFGYKDEPVILYIHGFMGDFYTNNFVSVIANDIIFRAASILLAQHRGTGVQTYFNRVPDGGEVIGSFFEKLEESHLDISAWISKLKQKGFRNIYLCGHSLGTLKAVRYLFEGEYKSDIRGLFLLSPFDKTAGILDFTEGKINEYLKMSESAIANNKNLETIPSNFDEIVVSYQTYYSWYKNYDLNNIWDFYKKEPSEILKKINIPTYIIFGDQDEFVYSKKYNNSALEVKQLLEATNNNFKVDIIDGAGHSFKGYENILSEKIIKFLKLDRWF